MNTLVSIIVPVYNAEKYLKSCVESLCAQTYGNIEIVLVDDGSSDGSLCICHHFADKDKRILVLHQENGGVSSARNLGLDNANGSYITFVDSDDELQKDAVERMLADALDYNADIVSTMKCYVNKDGNEVVQSFDDQVTKYCGTEALLLSLHGDKQTNSVCAKLFSSDFIQDLRFCVGHGINEDGFYLFECYVRLPVLVQHNICTYKYYERENSSSRGVFSDKYYDMLFFCNEKKRIIENFFPQFSADMKAKEVSTHISFLMVLCRTADKKYRNDEKNSIKFVKENYAFFTPKSKNEMIVGRLIRVGLYPIYKKYVWIRYYRNIGMVGEVTSDKK